MSGRQRATFAQLVSKCLRHPSEAALGQHRARNVDAVSHVDGALDFCHSLSNERPADIVAGPKAPTVRLMSPDGSLRSLQSGDLPIEVALLLEVRGRSGCGSVRLDCGSTVARHLEEVAADRVEAPIGVDPGVGPKTLDQFEAGPGPGDHADGDGVVERDDRVVVQAEQDAVEGDDLGPVGRLGALGLVVDGGDRRLELVWPGRPARKGGGDERDPLLDGTPVPQAAVLLRHGDERPVGGRAGPVPGVDEEHQREQPGHLAVVGQRRVERPGEADRLLGQVDPDQRRPRRARRTPR